MSRIPLCLHLRWKERYGLAFRDDDELAFSMNHAGVPFTCNKTCQAWGPDDHLVAPETCDRDRGCYEETPGRAAGRAIT